MNRISKVLLIIGLTVCSCTFIECSAEDLQGFANAYFDADDANRNGYTYVGNADSERKCILKCASKDYENYRYNYNTKSCYCK